MSPTSPTVDRNIVITAGTNANVTSPKHPPRPALTAFGPQIELVARSYAPFAAFGMPAPVPGFEGDGDERKATTDRGATARVTSIALLSTVDNTVSFSAFSDSSSWPVSPIEPIKYVYWPSLLKYLRVTATGIPSVEGDAAFDATLGSLKITMHHSGKVPLMHPQFAVPAIDLHTEFLIAVAADGSMHVATAMQGDAFPSAEAFARLGDGRAVLLHHFETSEGRLGPAYMLGGDSKRSMGSTTVVVPPTRPT